MTKEAQVPSSSNGSPAESADKGPMSMVSSATAVALANRSPAHVVLLDSSNNVVDVNMRTEKLLGKSAVDLRGFPPDQVFKRILNRVESIGLERAQRGFQIQYEKAWYDAQVFDTEDFADSKDDQIYRVIRATDITDRKTAEFELLESEARLEEATRIARMGTYKLYWDTTKVLWSHQMYDIHGLNPGTFDPSKSGYNDLIHPDDLQSVKDLVRDLVSGKEVSGTEYRIIRSDSAVIWVRLDGRVLFDSDGKPYATFGTLQDISEAKQREEELKDLVSRNTILTEALQASPIGVAIVTAESEEPAIFYVNSTLEDITGFVDSSLIGMSLDRLKGAETDQTTFAAIQHSIRSGSAHSFEVTLHRLDQAPFLAQLDVAPVLNERGDRVVAQILIVRDITDDRRRTDAMMESQKMEALGKLSGGVAHEINNLLQPIITLSDLGKESLDPENEKLTKYFDVIAGSGRKAREVVRQILTFSRQDAPVIGAHDVAPIVEDAVQLAQSGLAPGVDLESSIEIESVMALVNPTQVSQVVINLIRNAADAMETGGTVTLVLDRVTSNEDSDAPLSDRPKPWIRLSISDTGCGISEESRARIFEPFFTTKPVGKGTGLGLSVVYSIVLGWGGTIELDSEVDRGTTAMVYIPEFLDT